MAKTFTQLIDEARAAVPEIFPWDLEDWLREGKDVLLLDVREPFEYDVMKVKGSLTVPRGVLETAVEWGFEETVPELVQARARDVVVMCRSGNRSLLAGKLLQEMGFEKVHSLQTGLRGWNDNEQALIDESGNAVDIDDGDAFFDTTVLDEQLGPK